jgi:glycosyltransferase involved in cell wall biosynthesis
MRILIVADNASSRFGGEAFLPLNYFRLLRQKGIDVHLLVHERTRAELLESFPDDTRRLHFVKDTLLHKAAFRVSKYLPRRVAESTAGLLIHLSTQLAQKRAIRSLSLMSEFDVIHVPTPVSPKIPSLMYGLSAPVVFGPLNGGMNYPSAFRRQENFLTRLVVAIGRSTANAINLLFPGKRKARVILVANRRTQEALPRGVRAKIIEMVENGVDFSVWRRTKNAGPADGKCIFAFVGRLVDWKALDIVLEALTRVRDRSRIKLLVIGDGPMREAWELASRELGLQSNVTFCGWMSQTACADQLQEAHALLLPSIYECGGAAVLEAMAMGLPVVATAWGGPLDYLDESCGILIPPTSRDSMIAGFAKAIEDIADSAALRQRLGRAGSERARQRFNWDDKLVRMLEIYSSVKNV